MLHNKPSSNPSPGSPTGSQKFDVIVFTDRSIKHLAPESKRRVVWAQGLPGLGVRITPKGTKSFVYKYDIDGQDRWLTIGQYPKVTLAEAFQKYGDALEKVAAGEDPAGDRVKANAERRNAPTVAQLAEEYIEKYARPRKRSWEEDQRVLDHDVLPAWKNRKAAKITRRDVIALLDGIVARGAPVQANRTLAVVRRMFNFAVDRDILPASPCHRVKPASKEAPKVRYLTLDEIRQFWVALETAPLESRTKSALKVLLLTLQRNSEVIGLRKDELDLRAKTWIIPAERTKNGRPHLVPLSGPAVEIITGLIEDAGDDGYLFPGKADSDHMTNAAISQAVARNLEHFGLSKFTPHDLRRTGSTQLAAFKVPRFDRDRVLNHTDRTIGAVYDVYGYQDEKRAVLDMWADIVMSAVKSRKAVDTDKLRAAVKYPAYFSG